MILANIYYGSIHVHRVSLMRGNSGGCRMVGIAFPPDIRIPGSHRPTARLGFILDSCLIFIVFNGIRFIIYRKIDHYPALSPRYAENIADS